MYYLECERIVLHPLSANHLHWFVKDIKKLEKALNLESTSLDLNGSGEFKDQLFEKILKSVIPLVRENTDQYMWYTHWIIIHKDKKIILGGIGIQGEPDRNNEVFLNFYEDNKFEKEEFSTEALHCMGQWLLKTGKVSAVKIITTKDQVRAQKVLERSGFSVFKKRIDEIEWVYPD